MLDKLPALGATASAGMLAVMMRLAVVAGQFFSGADRAQSIDLNFQSEDADERVRRTGMIDVSKQVAATRRIDGLAMIHFHDRDAAQLPGAFASFALADDLAGELTELLSLSDGRSGEHSLAVDRAAFHDKSRAHIRVRIAGHGLFYPLPWADRAGTRGFWHAGLKYPDKTKRPKTQMSRGTFVEQPSPEVCSLVG